MPTLPLLAGDLRFFASSPALPLWYINLPSTINIEYLVKDWTLITAFLFSLNHKEMLKLRWNGEVPNLPPPPHWRPIYSPNFTALGGSSLLLTRFCWLPLKISGRLPIFEFRGLACMQLMTKISCTWWMMEIVKASWPTRANLSDIQFTICLSSKQAMNLSNIW